MYVCGVYKVKGQPSMAFLKSYPPYSVGLFLFVCFGRVSLRSEDFHASWVHWPMSLRHPPIFASQAVR